MSDYTNPDWLCIHSVVNHQCKKCWPYLAAPLPPAAEQTSIARFNALADQIREDREAISSWISLCRRELSAKLDIIINSKKECPDAEMCGCVTHCEHDHPKRRAVAKKKAAPLVGKRGRKS